MPPCSPVLLGLDIARPLSSGLIEVGVARALSPDLFELGVGRAESPNLGPGGGLRLSRAKGVRGDESLGLMGDAEVDRFLSRTSALSGLKATPFEIDFGLGLGLRTWRTG